MAKYFSQKNRPFHLSAFPLEKLRRSNVSPDLGRAPPLRSPDLSRHGPESLAHAMARYQAMLDIVRGGPVRYGRAEVPSDPEERAAHLKAASYYYDASMTGLCELAEGHLLEEQRRNPMIADIRSELEKGQPKGFAGGIEMIYANVLAASQKTPPPLEGHSHALVFLVEYTRDPRPDEPGTDWFQNTQVERAALLSSNTAILLAEYLRLLGFDSRAHSLTATDVDLNRLALSAGLCTLDDEGTLVNPFVGERFGLAAVTTTMAFATDRPLASTGADRDLGLGWKLGMGSTRRAGTAVPYADREFRHGALPFETLKRQAKPTTFIDEERIPRFPKRADFFARALFGDLGKKVQDNMKGGHYVSKSPIGACARNALGALLMLQYGEARGPVAESTKDPERNAENLRGTAYYLSVDAAGLSAAPDWVYYSHNGVGQPLAPYHDNAISLLIDQGFETMDGASGDDWVSSAQSMRAYLRFSLLGGVIAEQVRRLGYSARVHSVLDGEVLLPPLQLLAGLGEVSRIGDVILHPFLGPRLKSGAVTTPMPMGHDRPIDFGLQNFCNSCLKCARECPSGAITAGPKVMYNGYEIWRTDAEKCTRYRLTNASGSMCGRCMKTCPWNLEGLFTDAAFRWMAMNAPKTAGALAAIDDLRDRGDINPVKKWWWDIEISEDGTRFVAAKKANSRGLQKELKLRHDDQTLAVYPADLMPSPYPVVQPIDREAGIARYRKLLSPEEYKERLARGESEGLAPGPRKPAQPPPVFPTVLSKREDLAEDVLRLELTRPDGKDMPEFSAGAHVDVLVAPEFTRQFSLAGDPADRSRYVLGVLRETQGRGGSALLHQTFKEGKTVILSPPRNHFPLDEEASFSLLFAGGIGITPLLAMGHRLHALGKDFLLHFSARSEERSGFARELRCVPWSDKVFFHFSSESGRADFKQLIPQHRTGMKLYTCGGEAYMNQVFEVAESKGWSDKDLAREYFSAPEAPDYDNQAFSLRLLKSDRVVEVGESETATEALDREGISVSTKCSDGLCGVCATPFVSGDIEHRDHVLSAQEREHSVILCCSRARERNGVIEVML
ncbi:MAG: 4Fe-4S dicluster domain-containing protein [Pseudomonadota bacterium]